MFTEHYTPKTLASQKMLAIKRKTSCFSEF